MIKLGSEMTQEKLKKLKEYLESNQAHNPGMNLYELHGFITCLAIGPEIIMPGEWLPVALGTEPDLGVENKEVLDLIFTFYNSICQIFVDNPDKYKILLNEDETDENKTMLTAWSRGFYEGLNYDMDFWEEFLEIEDYHFFYIALGAHIPDIAKEMNMDMDYPEQEIKNQKEVLEQYIQSIYRDILEIRQDEENTVEQIFSPPNVGRNDPCPCGSGKKFKKCCMN